MCRINHSSFFSNDCCIFVKRNMNIDYPIPEPFLFNPMKHHLVFIKEYWNISRFAIGMNDRLTLHK